jgi:hypothetical protein
MGNPFAGRAECKARPADLRLNVTVSRETIANREDLDALFWAHPDQAALRVKAWNRQKLCLNHLDMTW